MIRSPRGRRFVGRQAELARLDAHLDAVRTSGSGLMCTIRGRRQVGKSRLVEELVDRPQLGAVFFTASERTSADELALFSGELAGSPVPGSATARAGALGTWEAALEIACSGATPEHPVIIVLDELPYLMRSEPAIEAILQKQWDRVLSRLPVLVLLVGSDVSMMCALSEYGRPLYGRHREMVVRPLPPAEICPGTPSPTRTCAPGSASSGQTCPSSNAGEVTRCPRWSGPRRVPKP